MRINILQKILLHICRRCVYFVWNIVNKRSFLLQIKYFTANNESYKLELYDHFLATDITVVNVHWSAESENGENNE